MFGDVERPWRLSVEFRPNHFGVVAPRFEISAKRMKQHNLLRLSGQSDGACNRRHAANSRCHKTDTLTWCHCTFIESPSTNNEANTICEKHDSCPLWVKSRHLQCKRACPLYPL